MDISFPSFHPCTFNRLGLVLPNITETWNLTEMFSLLENAMVSITEYKAAITALCLSSFLSWYLYSLQIVKLSLLRSLVYLE